MSAARHPAFAVLAVAAFALAGCASTGSLPETPAPGSDPRPGRTLIWGLQDCTFSIAVIGVPHAAVAPHLPEGFRSISPAEMGLAGAPNPQGDANFGMEMFSCRSGQGLDGAVPALAYGSFFTAVEPPQALRHDVDYHFVKWDVLVPDAPRRELLRSYGIPAVDGRAEFAVESNGNGPAAYHRGALSLNGSVAATFTSTALAPFEGGSFVEFTQTPTGLATWEATFTFLAGGVGPQLVEVAPGTLAAEVLGAGAHSGVGFAGRLDFTEASVTLPGPATA